MEEAHAVQAIERLVMTAIKPSLGHKNRRISGSAPCGELSEGRSEGREQEKAEKRCSNKVTITITTT